MTTKQKFYNVLPKAAFRDARGEIYDLLEEKVGHIGLITFSKKGVVRANHYHLRSTQYSYILEGKIKLTISDVNGKNKRNFTLKPGMVSAIPPRVVHTYTALTPAKILDMTTLNRKDNGYEKDTVRMPR